MLRVHYGVVLLQEWQPKVAPVSSHKEHPVVDEPAVIRPGDMLLALAIGTEALAMVVPPWCGLGWTPWAVYLAFPTVAFALVMRYRWLR